MTYTVHMHTPGGLTRWDGTTYVELSRAEQVARDAWHSRDGHRRVEIFNHADQLITTMHPEPTAWAGNPQVEPADDGHVLVTFRWSTEHGDCFECDAPAGWVLWPYGADRDPVRACAVCACNHAQDGARVENIANHVAAYGYAPDETPED